jgi:hypothetical protein
MSLLTKEQGELLDEKIKLRIPFEEDGKVFWLVSYKCNEEDMSITIKDGKGNNTEQSMDYWQVETFLTTFNQNHTEAPIATPKAPTAKEVKAPKKSSKKENRPKPSKPEKKVRNKKPNKEAAPKAVRNNASTGPLRPVAEILYSFFPAKGIVFTKTLKQKYFEITGKAPALSSYIMELVKKDKIHKIALAQFSRDKNAKIEKYPAYNPNTPKLRGQNTETAHFSVVDSINKEIRDHEQAIAKLKKMLVIYSI